MIVVGHVPGCEAMFLCSISLMEFCFLFSFIALGMCFLRVCLVAGKREIRNERKKQKEGF